VSCGWGKPGSSGRQESGGWQGGGPGASGQPTAAGPGGRFLGASESGGQTSGLGPREDVAWCAVTNCKIILRVSGLGWAWVDWEAASCAK